MNAKCHPPLPDYLPSAVFTLCPTHLFVLPTNRQSGDAVTFSSAKQVPSATVSGRSDATFIPDESNEKGLRVEKLPEVERIVETPYFGKKFHPFRNGVVVAGVLPFVG